MWRMGSIVANLTINMARVVVSYNNNLKSKQFSIRTFIQPFYYFYERYIRSWTYEE